MLLVVATALTGTLPAAEHERYFGQQPPGPTAEPFGRAILQPLYRIHGTVAFSPGGKEAYWAVLNFGSTPRRAILMSRLENGRWTAARLASFSDGPYDDVPFVSPDGKKLFFISARPLEPGGKVDTERIWMVQRKGDLWGGPQPLPPPVNQVPQIHHQVSTDAMGNLYFAAEPGNGYGSLDVHCSELKNGVYQTPVNLGPVINGPAGDATPFIAPDGSYLLFTRFADKRSSVFVSFLRDGNWLAPIDLAKHIPYRGRDNMDCARVTPDGRYFLFTTWGEGGDAAYWTDAAFLERLRPKLQATSTSPPGRVPVRSSVSTKCLRQPPFSNPPRAFNLRPRQQASPSATIPVSSSFRLTRVSEVGSGVPPGRHSRLSEPVNHDDEPNPGMQRTRCARH